MIMESAKNGRWIIPLKKFGKVRVNYNKHYLVGLTAYIATSQVLLAKKRSLFLPWQSVPVRNIFLHVLLMFRKFEKITTYIIKHYTKLCYT